MRDGFILSVRGFLCQKLPKTITFSESGVVSSSPDASGGNDNSVNNTYFGSVGRDSGRETTWTFDRAIGAFSFNVQGANSGLAIRGLFDGAAAGPQTVVFNTVGINNSGSSFFGLIGGDSFNSFTWFDGSETGNGNDFNFKVDDLTASVPTPALLPGLIGMGVAAIRKRKQEDAVENS